MLKMDSTTRITLKNKMESALVLFVEKFHTPENRSAILYRSQLIKEMEYFMNSGLGPQDAATYNSIYYTPEEIGTMVDLFIAMAQWIDEN